MVTRTSPFSGGAQPSPEEIKAWLRETSLPPERRRQTPRDSLELLQAQRKRLLREIGASSEPGRRRATLRFVGDVTSGNEMPASIAVTLIGDFQSLITAAAERLREAAIHQLPKKEQGRHRRKLKNAVDLLFSPQPTMGSTVFHLWEPSPSLPEDLPSGQEVLMEDTGPPLVDSAVGRVFDVLEAAASENIREEDLKEDLRNLGKKHAGRLGEFASHLLANKVQLDLTWGAPELPKRRTCVRRREAAFLKELVRAENERTEVVTLLGSLLTVSSFRKVDLKLRSGKIITAETTEHVRQQGLARFYEKHVRVVAEVRKAWSETRDDVKAEYLFRHIELHAEGDNDDGYEAVPFDDS